MIHRPHLARLVRLLVVPLLLLAVLAATRPANAADDENGFRPIFDGKSLEGWDGDAKFWSVKEGVITGQTTAENPTSGNTFLIWRQGEVDDFELRLSYRIVGGNSGIQYRSSDLGNHVVGGYQGDFEAGDTYSGILYEERGRGILAQRGQKTAVGSDHKPQATGSVGDSAELQKAIKKEDWNDYTIVARGNHLAHFINGKQTVDVTDNDSEKQKMTGILALQLHAGPPMTVQFKNVRLKRLKLEGGRKKIVLVAGRPSHGKGEHEFNAGVTLLRHCLDQLPQVVPGEYHDGWPTDPTAFDNADAVLLYMDGGGGHPLIQPDHLRRMGELMHQGVGLACAHYAVEVPKERGGPELLAWIGGYYETGFSINPHWDADFKEIPEHAVTRGVKPFKINDEWYFNLRFREGAVTPILVATPPEEVRREAAKAFPGRPEIVAWTTERPDGGRGFGFTGGHFHRNWSNDDFRKLVLNALFWVAKLDVPSGGVECKLNESDLAKNLDKK